MNPWLPILSHWVQLLLIFFHWDKPGIVNLLFPIEMSPWLSHLSCWVQLLLHFFHWDKPAIAISHWNESLVVPSFPLREMKVLQSITLLNLKFPVEMSPRFSPLSHWVQLLLKIFHWDKPAIVISRWNESLVVPSFPLRDKGVAEYIFEIRMSIKPETPTFNLTCNFPLKWTPGYPFFPIEFNFFWYFPTEISQVL